MIASIRLVDHADDNATALTVTSLSSPSSPQPDTRNGTFGNDVAAYPAAENVTSYGNRDDDEDDDEEVASAASADTSGDGSVAEVTIQRYEVDDNDGLHVIHPAAAMKPGTYSLEIDYEAALDGKAIYSASYNESNEGK